MLPDYGSEQLWKKPQAGQINSHLRVTSFWPQLSQYSQKLFD